MAKLTTPLTSTQIDAAKSKDKDYSLFDGRGLILLVRTSGTKTWRYKYKNFLGTQIVLTLGKYPALKLQQARALRTEFERMLANGEDPKEQQVLKKAKANNANSLESITRNWLDSYAIRKPLSEESKHKRLRKFENHLFPKFKNKAIDQIKLHELKNTLNTIYKDSPDNAQRIRADLISIFGYALQHSFIDLNIARELDDMDLSAKKNNRATFKSLEPIPELLRRIKADTGHSITKLFLQFALHTFARSSELRFARWSEIDFDKKQWVIPATREFVEGSKHSSRGAKMRDNHIVPLSPQAITLLEQIHEYSSSCDQIFPSPNDRSNFLSENTPNDALRRMGYSKEEISLHGFRALARSALGEMGIFQRDALEKQMSHQERNNTVGAYTHIAEYMEERVKIMNTWSNWLYTIQQEAYITPYDYARSESIRIQN
ncbi:tyrosine-type recombinase/integrase [Acinetobacter dispersus]|uniref:tyrosine-type recombinase/integrase n=2 Tax=Acinetobacter TaxID=469 RepID=UPI0030094888